MAYTVDFEPVGRRVFADPEASLLSVAQDAGVDITAVCGGVGVCQACKIRCMAGELSDIQTVERETFSADELKNGWRLACQAYPRSDLKIEIPPESMTTSQRLQIEGTLREVPLSPGVRVQPVSLSKPGLDDLRADWERFTETIDTASQNSQPVDLAVLAQFSSRIRKLNWRTDVLVDDQKHIIGFLQPGAPHYGLAVDIGTTKMAAFLINLQTGQIAAKLGAMNPQIAYGEDVVARISFANQGESNRLMLQNRLVETLNTMMADLCEMVGIETDQVADFVVVGNTAMHHLFSGLSVRQLGQAPYVAAVRQAIQFPAREIGLSGAPGARVYMPPNIAGYVGADHVAMLLASDLESKEGVGLALDIGTNTEISLSRHGRLLSCSCASGPAFEGAHIHAGMRAVPGAIERARFYDGDWHVSTIDDQPPVGICGSGILDVVAALLESGQIDSTGRFTEKTYRRVAFEKGGAIILVPGKDSGTGEDIVVTRGDIREIQLAKAAIRAGVDALLRASDTRKDEIEHFIVAGAFGTYLYLDSAVQIGMFPRLPWERYHQIGNAAGAGAQEMLVSLPSRVEAESILDRMSYIELTTDPGFMESYVDSMGFERTDEEK